MSWYTKNKDRLINDHPEAPNSDLMKLAYNVFKEELQKKKSENGTAEKPAAVPEEDNKKRKLSDERHDEENQPKRSASSKLAAFARTD